MTTLAFVDTETLGLNPTEHAVWEIAVITRTEDGTNTEHLWQIKPSEWELKAAEPKALEINRYHERMAVPEQCQAADMTHICGLPHPVTRNEVRATLGELLASAILVGSNPSFDAAFLHVFLDSTPWHYRTIDIATLAAGYQHGLGAALRGAGGETKEGDLPAVPFSSRGLSRWAGVEPPGDDGHQALVDARWARDVYDAVTGGAK